MTMALFVKFISVLLTFQIVRAEPPKEVAELRAARGRDARLPCGKEDPFLDGKLGYVLWVNKSNDYLYRFPSETPEIRTGSVDRVLDSFCGSSDFCPQDTALVLRNVTEKNAGLYRCRIHYYASPAVDKYVNLTVVDSTAPPLILNERGEALRLGFAGPFGVGSNITLTCQVHAAGNTKTQLYWLRNGKMWKRGPVARTGLLRVSFTRYNITRAELRVQYDCIAQNSDISKPLTASVYVKMFTPPLSVEIRLDNNLNFEEGQPRVVDCVVVGCVPPPAINWQLGNALLRPNVHKELHDGNYTVSSLSFSPSLRFDHSELSCKAHNSLIPNEVYTDAVVINVGFRPTCESKLARMGVRSNEPQTTTCVVEASPEPQRFIWTFADSKIMYTSFTKVPGFKNRYAANLTWLPRNDDLGILLCRAANVYGEQKIPCSFNITTGGPPDNPECHVRRTQSHTLKVRCRTGWDGGRPQTVHLEVVDEDGTCLRNVTNKTGIIELTDIVVKRNISAVVYAANAWGRSKKMTTYLLALRPIDESEPRYVNEHWWKYSISFGVVVGLVTAGIILALFFWIYIAGKRSRTAMDARRPDLVQISEGLFHREPDFVRDERVIGTTNITVNQLTGCQNQYSPSPLPVCRVLADQGSILTSECPSQRSYYV